MLRLNVFVSVLDIKIFDSAEGLNSRNKMQKDFVLKLEGSKFAILAAETQEVEDSKNVAKVKYSVLGNIKEIYIQDNLKNSIFQHLLKFESDALKIYFRINETVISSDPFLAEVKKQNRRRSFSIHESDLEKQSPTTRKRLMSDEGDYKTENHRYFDKVAVIVKLTPLKVHLYDHTANLIKSMAEKTLEILDTLNLQNELKNGSASKSQVENQSGPFYSVDYIFISGFDIRLYTMSSTNLNVVNFLPNMEFKIKEKYFEFLQGASGEEIATSLSYDFKHDLSVGRILKLNIKHLPIFAALYKTGIIFEKIFKSAGNKNAEGIMSGFNQLLILGIMAFLKTGKFSIKVLSDIFGMFGLNFVNRSKVDHVFSKWMSKLTGEKKKDNSALKSD